jgi:hypothetical protein
MPRAPSAPGGGDAIESTITGRATSATVSSGRELDHTLPPQPLPEEARQGADASGGVARVGVDDVDRERRRLECLEDTLEPAVAKSFRHLVLEKLGQTEAALASKNLRAALIGIERAGDGNEPRPAALPELPVTKGAAPNEAHARVARRSFGRFGRPCSDK